jgi:hypothetical protein
LVWLEKDLKEVKEYYNQHYYNEEIFNKIKAGVQQRSERKRWSLGKKIGYISSAAIAAVGLFMGAAFFSPTVANVAAKIPYLKMIFESKPIHDEIRDTLTAKGYEFDGFGVQYNPKKIVSVALVGSEEYVKEATPEVEKLIKDLLMARNFDAYEIEVYRAENRVVELTPEDKKRMEEYDKMSKVIEEVLKKYGRENTSYGDGPKKNTLVLNLPNTELRIEEIKQDVQSGLTAIGMGHYSVEVDVYNAKKREREERWMPIINTIAQGIFGSKEYKVKGVGYTNKSATHMTIIITTTVDSTDGDSDKVVKNIENTIQEFLQSDKTQELVKGDPYKVIIRTKDKKEIVISSDLN